ncbi:MAG: metallophosphoesterase [Clostridiales bacterium]|nr:metallophosphoesterase [Clostridiales bacterium]
MSRIAVTEYKVHIGLKTPLRCALISDLHDRDPDAALVLLQKENPDLILAAGDLMERHEEGQSEWTAKSMDEWQGIPGRRSRFTGIIRFLDGSLLSGQDERKKWDERNGCRFIKEAGEIAPIVVGVGNHEWYYLPEDYALAKPGRVILLDNQDCELMIKGQVLRIGALSTRYDLKWLSAFSVAEPVRQGVNRVSDTSDAVIPKLLICHHPDYYIRYVKDTPLDTFDLVVAGHTHGGQWRLFSEGGKKRGIPVFAPGQGLFPKYAYGRYGKMIVSSGVSNTTGIPRFGNPCEAVILQMD